MQKYIPKIYHNLHPTLQYYISKLQPTLQKIQPHLTQKKLPRITAITILILTILWIATGSVITAGNNQAEQNTNNITTPQAQKVKSYHSIAINYQPTLTITGKTKPNKQVQIKSEISGTIEEISYPIGSVVEKNTTIAKFKIQDNQAKLQQAQTAASHAEKNYQITQQLHAQNFQSDLALLEAENQYKTAEATLATQQKLYNSTQIKTPYKSVIAEKHVEEGDYLNVGDPIITIMEANPLLLEATISERNFYDVKVGQVINVTISNQNIKAKTITATITAIAPAADPQTRSFAIEAAINNDNYDAPINATAIAKIRLQTIKSYRIKASHLSLNDDGIIGIKILNPISKADAPQTARFVPISIVGDDNGILHVTGDLPEKIIIIGDGQGFITDGQTIFTIPEESLGS